MKVGDRVRIKDKPSPLHKLKGQVVGYDPTGHLGLHWLVLLDEDADVGLTRPIPFRQYELKVLGSTNRS